MIDLCDEILGLKAIRQYTFPFLVGDSGRRLPVDAFYEPHNLVVEYRESQHTEAVPFFDRKLTVSGCYRGEQRRSRRDLTGRIKEMLCSPDPQFVRLLQIRSTPRPPFSNRRKGVNDSVRPGGLQSGADGSRASPVIDRDAPNC